MFVCPICQKTFENGLKLGGHIGSHNRKPRGPSSGAYRKCEFCEKDFAPYSIGAHKQWCNKNPSFKDYKEARSARARKRRWSHEQREKQSQNILKKVENGNWHLSFSKSRTHDYKGIKFHGLWEVKFAMHLDKINVNWQRPIEKFQYSFEGKTRNYIPDFWIPEMDSYIEIKGYITPKDEAKWRQFPLNLIVLNGNDLVQLGLLKDNEVKKFSK